ncbi:MAG: alpha-glucosidase, partial [Leptolyngbyaceae cyanobacterium SL_7_1]|nr:alpha-glucosidase [Leptolyngbyaceae cyanobacterium SL_7_1]
ATIIGLGLSGIAFSGSDIGGFQGNPTPELYVRWFQCASFVMFCRTHSSNSVEHRSPWTYGEPSVSIIRQFLQLRYRLLPYLYTLSWEATQTGYPPVRPVFWADPTDAALWDVEDAFLLGDALLVCPVVEAGGRSRSITLPKGHWYNYWDDTLLMGATTVSLDAPLEQIPLLVKAGTALPMEEDNHLTLHLYPATAPSQTTLYSDAGDGDGAMRLDRFHVHRQDQGMAIEWHSEGEFAFPYTGVTLQLHAGELLQAWVDDREVECKENRVGCDRPFHRAHLRMKHEG